MPYTQTFGFSRTSSVVGGNALSPLNYDDPAKTSSREEDMPDIPKVNTDPNSDKDIIVQNNEKSDEEYSWKEAGKDILSHSWDQFKEKSLLGKLNTIKNPSTFIDTSINPEIDKKLNTLQNATTLTSFGAGVTGAGEVASVPMDIGNALFSFKRSMDMGKDVYSGDRTDVASKDAWKHAGYGIWHGAEAIPFIGTGFAGTRLASLGMKHMPKTISTIPKLTSAIGKGWSNVMSKAPASVQKLFSKGKGISTGHHGTSQAADVAHGGLSVSDVASQTDFPSISKNKIKFPTKPLATTPSIISGFGANIAAYFGSSKKTKTKTKKNHPYGL